MPRPVGVSDFSRVHSMDVDNDDNEVASQNTIAEESITGNNGRSRYTCSDNQSCLVGHKMTVKLPSIPFAYLYFPTSLQLPNFIP